MMFFQDTLEIPKAMEGYWLVTWPGGKKGSTIDHVEVIYPSEQSARAPIWTQATARGAGVNGEYQFEIGAPLPASQVKIHVMWPDFCSRAKVYSRGSQDSNWEFHADTTLYNLAAGDNNIQNGALMSGLLTIGSGKCKSTLIPQPVPAPCPHFPSGLDFTHGLFCRHRKGALRPGLWQRTGKSFLAASGPSAGTHWVGQTRCCGSPCPDWGHIHTGRQ